MCQRTQLVNDLWIPPHFLFGDEELEFKIAIMNQSATHGYCPECYKVAKEELAKYKERKKREQERADHKN